ncbi:hypothetical protein [Aestuariispira insulae]|uniref:Uncharacterized protein n=1 Tax=Aestuariispira insulae TaxID=1461337 RepID=A0A3D9HQE2_9PROT|nr:hypothetical protein [Aestuariispira insulae]RED51531.1 hypothetical protein DFP90_103334 [Aestuariispira insulae]
MDVSAAASAAQLAQMAQKITLSAAQAQQVQQLGKIDEALQETTEALTTGLNSAGRYVNLSV